MSTWTADSGARPTGGPAQPRLLGLGDRARASARGTKPQGILGGRSTPDSSPTSGECHHATQPAHPLGAGDTPRAEQSPPGPQPDSDCSGAPSSGGARTASSQPQLGERPGPSPLRPGDPALGERLLVRTACVCVCVCRNWLNWPRWELSPFSLGVLRSPVPMAGGPWEGWALGRTDSVPPQPSRCPSSRGVLRLLPPACVPAAGRPLRTGSPKSCRAGCWVPGQAAASPHPGVHATTFGTEYWVSCLGEKRCPPRSQHGVGTG